MTDRELVMELLRKINQRILYDGAFEDGTSIEIENAAFGEQISFDFDEDGKIIRIYS